MAPAISVHVDSEDDTEQYIDVLQRGFEISEGKLRFNGRPFLQSVPTNVCLSPYLSVYLRSPNSGCGTLKSNSAFLGFTSPDGAAASRHVASIGKLKGVRFTSLFRFKLWWTSLWVGDRGSDLETETQFLLLDTKSKAAADGCHGYPYVLLLPIHEGGFRASLQAGHHDNVDVCVESGSSAAARASFRTCVYLHAGHDPYLLVKDAVKAVRAHLGSFRHLEEKTLPAMVDHFGWCTWDAMYLEVNPRGIWRGLQSLSHAGVPPKFLIIDDGWQSTSHDHQHEEEAHLAVTPGDQMWCRLTTIRENSKFKHYSQGTLSASPQPHHTPLPHTQHIPDHRPRHLPHPHHDLFDHIFDTDQGGDDGHPLCSSTRGLGAFVHDLKAGFEHLDDVFVWHALVGYWGGVRPGVRDSFKSRLVQPKLEPGVSTTMEDLAVDKLMANSIGVVPPSCVHKFYDALHGYLAKNGVSGVKVDVIQVLEMLGEDFGGRLHLSKAYYDALSESIRKNFGGNRAIASMEHCNDFMLLGTEQISVGRVGDDFWCADAKGDPFWLQGVHMVHCAYNSLWMGQFIQPDWDMFQSKHVTASFHAAARAISGGPIYVSDKPGEHDFDLLKRLVLPDGSLLRCSTFALPTMDCLFHDPLQDGETVLKVWNLNKCGGVVGVFNCQGGGWSKEERRTRPMPECRVACEAVVRAGDIAWNESHEEELLAALATTTFAVLCHNSRHVVILRGIHDSLHVALQPIEFDVYTIVPMTRIKEGLEFAPLGLMNMFNAGGAVQHVSCIGGNPGGHVIKVGVRGSGQFIAYASTTPHVVKLNGVVSHFDYVPSHGHILVDIPWIHPHGNSSLTFEFSV